jgi:hypothetical protein
MPREGILRETRQGVKPMIREAVHEALGDVPKHMKMAGENRMWLYFLTAGLFITGVILLIV